MTDISGWRRVEITADNPETAQLRHAIDMGALPANARLWEKLVEDGRLRVIRTIEPNEDGSKWTKHVSVAHSGPDNKPGRYPTWDEQKEVCWTFAPGVRMYSIMPAENEPYVNHHPTTFHWWEEI